VRSAVSFRELSPPTHPNNSAASNSSAARTDTKSSPTAATPEVSLKELRAALQDGGALGDAPGVPLFPPPGVNDKPQAPRGSSPSQPGGGVSGNSSVPGAGSFFASPTMHARDLIQLLSEMG
jgi:hypothetical protein